MLRTVLYEEVRNIAEAAHFVISRAHRITVILHGFFFKKKHLEVMDK